MKKLRYAHLATEAEQQGWRVGIMAGCIISPLAFTMAMEVIIRASRWVVGGGEHLASIG